VISSFRQHARWATAAFALAALTVAAACGGSSGGNTGGTTSFKGTKNIGLSTALTGQSALYGHAIS